MKIVIIGNGPASVKALEAIATHKAALKADEAEITPPQLFQTGRLEALAPGNP